MSIRLRCTLLLLHLLANILQINGNKGCEDIEEIRTGKVVYLQANYAAKHSAGTIAFRACNLGYLNSFPLSVVCQANGKWSDKLGECTEIGKENNVSCDAQDVKSGVTYFPNETPQKYPSGTIVALRCALGEVPTGTISALCFNGKWNAKLGSCRKMFGDIVGVNEASKPVLITKSGTGAISSVSDIITQENGTKTVNDSFKNAMINFETPPTDFDSNSIPNIPMHPVVTSSTETTTVGTVTTVEKSLSKTTFASIKASGTTTPPSTIETYDKIVSAPENAVPAVSVPSANVAANIFKDFFAKMTTTSFETTTTTNALHTVWDRNAPKPVAISSDWKTFVTPTSQFAEASNIGAGLFLRESDTTVTAFPPKVGATEGKLTVTTNASKIGFSEIAGAIQNEHVAPGIHVSSKSDSIQESRNGKTIDKAPQLIGLSQTVSAIQNGTRQNLQPFMAENNTKY